MQQVKALEEYQRVNAHAALAETNPYKLINMLMCCALDRMASAKGYIVRKDIEKRNHMINKAVDIIGCLQESLNHKYDPEMTANLYRLYEYMIHRLFEANVEGDVEAIEEVMRLLNELYDAWQQLEDRLEGVNFAELAANVT